MATEFRPLVRHGLKWKAVSQISLQAIRIVVVVVLAHLLTPTDFGLAAMVFAFSALAHLFTDLTLGSALVQRRTIGEEERSTVFWTSAGAGLLLTLVGLAVAGPIADFYGEPEVRSLFAAVSLLFAVGGLATTQSALLARSLRFRANELIAIAAALAGGAAAVAVAAAGGGAWAFVAQRAGTTVVTTGLLWAASTWRPRLTYSIAALRRLSAFSGNLVATRLLFYAHRNVDNILIGRYLGPGPLGSYALAYNLILVPFTRIVDPVRSVLFPVLSRAQEERQRLADTWLRVTRLLAAVIVPAMAGLAVVAQDGVTVVLGDRWEASTDVIRILAFVGMLQSLAALNSVVLPVLDRTGTLFRFSLVTVLLSLAGFVAGLPWGIEGVAAGYLAANLIVVPLYTRVTGLALGVGLRTFAGTMRGVAEASAAMFVAVVLAQAGLVEAGVPAAVRLILVVALGVVVFVPLCVWRAPEIRADLRRLLRREN